MTLQLALKLLSDREPTLGAFQCLVAFPNGTFRALYQHGTRPFAEFAELDAWLDQVANPPLPPSPPVNPS